jgi:hypothetical protein
VHFTVVLVDTRLYFDKADVLARDCLHALIALDLILSGSRYAKNRAF